VYGLGASALGYARARARGAAAPFVFNPQGLEEFGATDPGHAGASLKRLAYAPLRRAVRTCALAADRVIATDHVLAPVVRRHLGVAPERLCVIPNGVDLDTCDRLAGPDEGRQMRERYGIGERDLVLLSVGRLEANKGFEVLVRALAQLGSATGQWLWVLVGDGPRRSSIEREIASRGLRDRVRLVGRIGDAELHAWYEAANLVVHPTLYEGSSLVTLEAMAHRRAVLATRAGGLPDKVRPGISGWLVDPGDAAALAAALGEALAHVDRLHAMGHEGRALAEQGFSWPRVADAFLRLCAELVSGRPPMFAVTRDVP
jgi:glycosyltransferase involved in cell wall biosynthesis